MNSEVLELHAAKNVELNITPYQPRQGAPGWLLQLAESTLSASGVVALLGPSGINVSTEHSKRARIILDPMGVYLAGLADRMRSSGQFLAIGCPPVARHLPLLLAASAVLANTVDVRLGRARRPSRSVLVVSHDLDVRSRYCDLFVKSIPLESAHAGSRLRPTGEQVALGHNPYSKPGEGVCFYLPLGGLPGHLRFQPGLIIIDLRHPRSVKKARDLLQWAKQIGHKAGILALYWVGDIETLAALTDSGYVDLPIDHGAIATSLDCSSTGKSNQDVTLDWWTADAPGYLLRRHDVVLVQNASLVEDVLSGIGRMLDEQSRCENPDLNRARWILAVLTHLPVSLIWYEMAARGLGRFTLRRLISWLGTGSRYDVGLGAVVQTLRMQFERLYNSLEKSNPRAETLRATLSRLPLANGDRSSTTLLLVRDRVVERAVQTWLEMEAFPGSEWLSALDVRACSDYMPNSKQKYKVSVVVGALPRRQRWLAGAQLGDKVSFIAYRHEVAIIEQQLLSIYGYGPQSARSEKRYQAVQQLVPHKPIPPKGSETSMPPLDLVLPPISKDADLAATKTIKPVFAKSLDKLKEAWASHKEEAEGLELPTIVPWQEDASSDDSPDETWEGRGQRDDKSDLENIICLRVEVESKVSGRGEVWLGLEEIVECVRPSSPNDILRSTPDHLRPGDILLRLEEGSRTSLFDRIVELAEGQPEMEYLAVFRRAWRTAIQRIVARYSDERGIDYGRILKALQEKGATIESEMAVRFWVRDQVIGPEKSKSIVAVGLVSGSTVLVSQVKEFDRAFRAIRGLHQGIGRRLNSVIRRSFTHFAKGLSEEASPHLDNRLGLPLEEILDTIDLAEIKSVSCEPEKKPLSQVGRLRKLSDR